jgi:hypothetical protein
MSDPDDDLFGDFHPERSEIDELQQFREALFRRVSETVEQDEIPEDLVPLLLAEIAVTFRATIYTLASEKPSSSGLKLDLDRFRRDIDHVVRKPPRRTPTNSSRMPRRRRPESFRTSRSKQERSSVAPAKFPALPAGASRMLQVSPMRTWRNR